MQGTGNRSEACQASRRRIFTNPIPILLFTLLLSFAGCDRGNVPQIIIEEHPDLESLIEAWRDKESALQNARYPDIVRAVSEGLVVPFNLEEPLDTKIWEAVGPVVKAAAAKGFTEEREMADWMRGQLDQTPELNCDPVVFESFAFGAPAIRAVHAESGRALFLVVSVEGERSLPLSLSPEEAFARAGEEAHHLSIHLLPDGWMVRDMSAISLVFEPAFRTRITSEKGAGVIGFQ